jgi:hypothetical protein
MGKFAISISRVVVSQCSLGQARSVPCTFRNARSQTNWLDDLHDDSFSSSPLYSGEKGPGDEGFGSEKFEVRSVNLKSQASRLKPATQVAIEQVPLGARKNRKGTQLLFGD